MKKFWSIVGLGLLLIVIFVPVALAQEVSATNIAAAEAPKIDTGVTTFIMCSVASVMLMTPGLGLFYAGMVRTKNALGTIMQSFFALGLISVQWALWGYSLAFGPDIGHLIGGLDWVGLNGVGQAPNPDYSPDMPQLVFMMFQAVFAIITPPIIGGAVAERVRFPAFAMFMLLWATFVYDPVAHWVWGVGGWIRELGALDFAGGTVVHILSGASALVFALVLGKRKGYGSKAMLPHNLPMAILGGALLWFGWFGFNAGSSLGVNGIAAQALATTHMAAAAGLISWTCTEWIHSGKPTGLGALSGAVAGLVAITPACGFVSIMSAIAIGAIGGIVCFLGIVVLKAKLGYDDSLDVFGVHGLGGTWGAVATGLFASKEINEAGANGLFFGNPQQLTTQLIAVIACWAIACVGTYIILKVLGLFMELRVTPEEEEYGLDISQHGEHSYGEDFVIGCPINREEFASVQVVGEMSLKNN